MKINGRATIFGDNINTDIIIPSKHLTSLDPTELGKHAMEGLELGFTERAKEGIIIVAGKNFGCGSSREQAPIALKYSGVKCVLAESFARIFYRNAINIGLPVLEIKRVTKNIIEGDVLTILLDNGQVVNKTKNQAYKATKMPRFILEILQNGGLIEHLKKKGADTLEV